MNRSRTAVALGAALALAYPTLTIGGEREQALEARVAELERLVATLLAGEAPPSPAAATPVLETPRPETPAVKPVPPPAGPGTEFRFTGFIKHDMMFSRYSGGRVPPQGVLRDFYVPAAVPVGGSSSATDFDSHTRETRFIFNVNRPDQDLQAYLEFDFSANTGGDERLTNATSPNVRQAFLRWRGLLAGQAWTTFFNVGALPENIDFIGPSEGTIFVRQPQLRYTHGPWQIAVENPETTVTPFGGGARLVTDTARMPDFVLRYNHSAAWGQFSLAGLARELGIDEPLARERRIAWGLSASGKIDLGQNDLRWMVSGGPGIGRYLGLNTVNDAVLDASGGLDTIEAWGGFLSYRHIWHPRWRSNFTVSMFRADHDIALSGTAVTRAAESAHVNLIYQATSDLRFGLEYIHARREIESGASGRMNRLQFATTLGF
ncbi:MAG: porin [Gammaproteobacteria bacterium]|nr:MAG: porin [Gammaproteobacteria bacterium]